MKEPMPERVMLQRADWVEQWADAHGEVEYVRADLYDELAAQIKAVNKKLSTLFCDMCGEPLPHSDISDGAHVCRSCWEREVNASY